MNSNKPSSRKEGVGNRYRFKHHILGLFFGALMGGALGAMIGTEQAIGGGILAGLIVGEIMAVIYTQCV
ncbi:hypothetical protein [Sinobacterium caligoides]|uniref:hypothetical protein n=1 Tax=Sinobacterium caligoides TaxID=933926 RepID=UPI0011CE8497|nr:hypothetical protein [Sinobacterium caligoides]